MKHPAIPTTTTTTTVLPSWRDPTRHAALLTSHIRSNSPAAALLHFRHMRTALSLPLDPGAFPPLLSACSSLHLPSLARQLHSLMLRLGCFHSSPIPATALFGCYSNCAPLADAVSLFDEMPFRDAVAWNALLSCFIRCNLPGNAVAAFRSMVVDADVSPTGFTLSSILKACAALKALRQGKQVHARVMVAGGSLSGDVILGTALIDLYSACGAVDDSLKVFHGMNCSMDTAAFNALIGGCVRNRMYKEAFTILRRTGRPNATTFTSVLSACSESFHLQFGRQIHGVIVRRFDGDTILCNALIDMYAKCGEITTARAVFQQMSERNVVSWTSIIDAYGTHGHGIEAVEMFNEMEEEEEPHGVKPNAVTFLSVLSACGHSGLVDEGRRCFFSMTQKYGIDPGPEHYTCYIDLLGRAGRIEEAWDLFRSLDGDGGASRLTSAVCVTMLNACMVGLDLGKGELTAKRLLELDPGNPGSYVLISNFYAAFGRWEGVEGLRRDMLSRGLRKETSSSHVAIQGC